MKSLPLKILTEIMNGTIIQGTDHLIIDNLVTRAKRINHGTLLFDLYHGEYNNPNLSRNSKSFAIVTDNPADFSGLTADITIIRVAKISEAYWKFVDFYRNLFKIPVIGVT